MNAKDAKDAKAKAREPLRHSKLAELHFEERLYAFRMDFPLNQIVEH